MDVLHPHVAGLDVHKKTVVACCLTPGSPSEPVREIRTFGTMTADLLALSAWLTNQQITHVAMESTGEFWKPIYQLLEGSFTVWVVNARTIKHVPGRKTDVKDAEWIATLLRHGLLQPSFIPPAAQRDLRDLTRHRTNLVQDRSTVVHRLHKVLEWANIKLTAVVSDLTGVSARSMLEALVAGQTDAHLLAELAKGRMRAKRTELAQALAGCVREHHRFMIAEHLVQLDNLDEQLTRFDARIATLVQVQSIPTHPAPPPDQPSTSLTDASTCTRALVSDEAVVEPSHPAAAPSPVTWEQAVTLLDTIPGVGRAAAQIIVAEIGTDMTRFGSPARLASWAKVCPGTHESAGKRSSSAIGQGNRWLRSTLVQAAQAAVHAKSTYLAGVYHRLVGRRGGKRAIIAVAHRILTAAYWMLTKNEPYHDLGADHDDPLRQNRLINRLRHRIEQCGYKVTLEPQSEGAA